MPDAKADSTLGRPLAGLLGRTVAGRYRIVQLLGQGGTGAVYEAERLPEGTPCAVKVLRPDAPGAALIGPRLRREARAAPLLVHLGLVAIHELVEEQGELHLVMELLRGRSVRAALHGGPLAARRTLVLARQVLGALAHAHAHGAIHRDLKPDHLFLTAEGAPGREYERVKLIDFGLIKLLGEPDDLTEPGMILGTPGYLPPEQALGQSVDARADLYALGVSLFEMLTGRLPFRSPDTLTLVRMHISAPPPALSQAVPGRPWCTPALEHLVSRALAKRPDDRFADAADMAAALDAAFASIDHLPPGT